MRTPNKTQLVVIVIAFVAMLFIIAVGQVRAQGSLYGEVFGAYAHEETSTGVRLGASHHTGLWGSSFGVEALGLEETGAETQAFLMLSFRPINSAVRLEVSGGGAYGFAGGNSRGGLIGEGALSVRLLEELRFFGAYRYSRYGGHKDSVHYGYPRIGLRIGS